MKDKPLKYKHYLVYKFNKELQDQLNLVEIKSTTEDWRRFYKTQNSNWILFYPTSEYHGGGIPYIIKIGLVDCEEWISNNSSFEYFIRKFIAQE